MHVRAFSLAALLTTAPAHAFICWSGANCNGVERVNVPCDGACRSFAGCSSFVAGGGSGPVHCVTFYTMASCAGQAFNFTNQGNQCTNVNTGTPVNSYRCFAGPGCS